jgi:hypothetical protein
MTGILTPAGGQKTCQVLKTRQVYGIAHIKAGFSRQEEAIR